ncbi:MAG: VTT domain-containing protein [Candidatus Lokiarchaeota archaeon]|nr:VTT domain-containing protein [Candidatus Lokiarchaeota archaeon]
MPVPKKLIIVFTSFYIVIIIYILLFLLIPDFQDIVIKLRENLTNITEGSNYLWALLISLVICFLGSASIGFPIPFPFVLFSLSNSILFRYLDAGFSLNEILLFGGFWLEIMGITLVGGIGSVLGEFTGYAVGYGAKKIAEERNSDLFNNVDGFGKLILENQKRTPLYIFLFALTPLPDDILFLPLGMIKYPFWKCIIPGWLGKNFTILFYCCWPIFIALGFSSQGIQSNNISTVIIEAILLLVTLVIMFFIMTFNWTKLLEKRTKRRESRTRNH